MSSRDTILSKLRAAQKPFQDLPPVETRRPMVPMGETTLAALRSHFITEAARVGCRIHEAENAEAVVEVVGGLLKPGDKMLAWDDTHIPVPQFRQTLASRGFDIAEPGAEATARVGVTGVDAALAATGTLVLVSGAGKDRRTSLLPDVHIAIVSTSQLMVDFESWMRAARENPEDFRRPSNTIFITGPSKTADIAQELILGAHGPIEVHIVLLTQHEDDKSK